MNEFEQALKAQGMRVSKTKRAIFECLSEADEPLSTQKLIKQLTGSHYVSVYRGLDALLKAGVVKQVPIGLKYRYELSDQFKPHHHHVTCEMCGASVPIESPEVEALMERITREAGLNPTRHHFEAYGVCAHH